MAARHLLQTATHWALTGRGEFSGFTYATPVTLSCRWEDKQELFRSAQGEELTSKAIVYVATDVIEGDYLIEGDYTDVSDPATLSEAFRVMGFSKIPDLRNIQMVRKAFL